jgi:hypothetical protein
LLVADEARGVVVRQDGCRFFAGAPKHAIKEGL